MNPASVIYFGAAAAIYTASLVWLQATRRRTHLINLKLQRHMRETAEDAGLADWARHTDLQVVSKGGTYFSITLADLYTGTAGLPRSWYDPVAVVISNHPADSHG